MATREYIFTPLQKKSFVDLLKNYRDVIENKNTDGASLRGKNEAWEKVTREYNASPQATSQVSSKQLRRLWMNLKQRQREALTKERQYRLGTGGRPSASNAAIDPDVLLVAPALIVGIEDAIDSDTTQETTYIMSEDIFIDSVPVSSSEPSTSSNIFLPTQPTRSPTVSIPLPLPLASPLPPPAPTTPPATPMPPTSLPNQPAASQSQSVQKTKNCILENEHKERQRRANEIHELEVLLLKEKIRKANEIHELEVLLLKEKIREAKAKADLAAGHRPSLRERDAQCRLAIASAEICLQQVEIN